MKILIDNGHGAETRGKRFSDPFANDARLFSKFAPSALVTSVALKGDSPGTAETGAFFFSRANLVSPLSLQFS